MRRNIKHHTRALLALSLLLTLFNAFKPVCIDDALYYFRARQVALHPLDPYGFRVFWNDTPEPAIQVLAPPLFPYYWSIAIRLFGERPFLWKLWLLPLSLLLVFQLYALLRRFAPGQELWLTLLVIISPVFLAGFNLMLEVPVAALSLLALNLFFRACERESVKLAVLAGLVNGLAMETKYTAFITAGVVVLYALIFRRLRLGVLAAGLAACVFAGLEGLTALRYGHSHFLFQSGVYSSVNPLKKYLYLAGPLVTLMGAVAPGLALLGWIGLRARARLIAAGGAFIVLVFVALAFLPEQYQQFSFGGWPKSGPITLGQLLFGVCGVAVYGTLLAIMARWCGLRWPPDWKSWLKSWSERRAECFLVLWLLLEVAGYFALSPIPAVRRMPGLLIVSALMVGRLASQSGLTKERERLWRAVVAGSMALGLLFYVVDLRDAQAEQSAVERTVQRISEMGEQQGGRVWYVGRWGFQYYAERSGMLPVVAGESDFREGDLLVTTDAPYFPEPVKQHIERYAVEPLGQLSVGDALPLRTMIGFYNSGIPLKHHEGPRRTVSIYRIHLAK